MDSFDPLMKAAIESFNSNTLKVAENHRNLGLQLIESIAKPFENLYKIQEFRIISITLKLKQS